MNADDLRLTAQLVAAGRVHSVSDEAVMALARRVLELEAQVSARLDAKDMVRARVMEEREACASICNYMGAAQSDARRANALDDCATIIRARGAK